MGKTVRISNSSLNSYGTRVLTTGVDLEQYKRNPIILWMHNRAWRGTTNEVLPIGYMTNIRVEGDDILGDVELKATTDFEKNIAEKWENGTLRMVSPNFDVIAVDESPELALPGQTRATVTKSKITEVSIVDIGGNDDNLQLNYQGKQLKLTEGGDCPDIPALHIINTKDKEEMELKTIALAFGLKDTATEADILALAAGMQTKDTKIAELTKQLDSLKLSGITGKVDAAIAEGRLPADKKESMIALGKMDAGKLDEVLSLMQKPVKATELLGGAAGAPSPAEGTALELSKATKLSEVPTEKWGELREKDLPLYKKLYKAEYGIDCIIA